MGSLTSAPKAPKPVIIQQPVSPKVEADPVIEDVNNQQDTEQEQSEERKRSLLARNRSRLGTIATGFRGLLQENNQTARKTLLGE